MIQIGITGGMACGKSTILEQIRLLGHSVFSADEAAKDVFDTDLVQDWLKEQIILRKGEEGYQEYFLIGKSLIRYLVVSDAQFKYDYEALMHPLIRNKMLDSNAKIAEIPLLFETGADAHFKHIWVIACHRETQIARLMNRMDCSREYAIAWIECQMPLKEKIQRANRVIYTDESEECVSEIVLKALEEDLDSHSSSSSSKL